MVNRRRNKGETDFVGRFHDSYHAKENTRRPNLLLYVQFVGQNTGIGLHAGAHFPAPGVPFSCHDTV
jgi:hypothetical protein